VQIRAGVIILTPVRVQRADAVRAKLAERDLADGDNEDAVAWARRRVADPNARCKARPTAKPRKVASRRS